MLLVSLAEFTQYTSSAVNFFVYYFVGSKYRETLHAMLRATCRMTTERAERKARGKGNNIVNINNPLYQNHNKAGCNNTSSLSAVSVTLSESVHAEFFQCNESKDF
jgi:hypothetical protein